MDPHVSRQMCRRRASQRWSALLTANGSRLAHNGIRARLGECLWSDFVGYAERHYRDDWDALFEPKSLMLARVGVDERPCPRAFCVDLRFDWAVERLSRLHLDHRYDLCLVCAAWLRAMPIGPMRTWHDGVYAAVVCQLLFGVTARNGLRACVVLRCGHGTWTQPAHTARVQMPARKSPAHKSRGETPCHTSTTHRLDMLTARDPVSGDAIRECVPR